ncbi:MAG TPA: hypothetical protein VGH80_13780 [Xanthomonadaceae bacterium]|jgi:hypothetical protein
MGYATRWSLLAGCGASVGALIHIAAVLGGPSWYVFFRAPPFIVASARAGTWPAPTSALAIALAMGICAAYAFSAAGRLPRLPLLRTGLAIVAVVCLLRGVLLVPFVVLHPSLVDTFAVVGSLVWLAVGACFALSFLSCKANPG